MKNETIMNSTQKAKDSLNKLAIYVLGKKDAKELTKEEILDFFSMQLASLPSKLEVTVEESRPTNVQFANNRWSSGITISLEGMFNYMTSKIENSDKPIDEYIKLNNMMRMIISQKYESAEQLLKELLCDAQKKDGIRPIQGSRFS